MGLIGGGGVVWLLLSLLPLFLSSHYVTDSAFLLHDVELSVGLAVAYDALLALFILITFGGLVAAALPNKRRYAMVTQGEEANGKVVKKRGEEKSENKDVSSNTLYTVIFCIINIAFKAPLLFVHGSGRYGRERALTPLFSAVLIALVLCAALLDSLMYLVASICKHSVKSDRTEGDNVVREQAV